MTKSKRERTELARATAGDGDTTVTVVVHALGEVTHAALNEAVHVTENALQRLKRKAVAMDKAGDDVKGS